MMVDGKRIWVEYERPREDDGDFVSIGTDALRAGIAHEGRLGDGNGIMVGLRELVDYALRLWSDKNALES